MAIDKKIVYELNIAEGLVTLTKATHEFEILEKRLDLEEGEFEEGEPDYVLVDEVGPHKGFESQEFWLEYEELSSYPAFISYVEGLCPAQNDTTHYYTVDDFESIRVYKNGVFYNGGIEPQYIVELNMMSICKWHSDKPLSNFDGIFLCKEFEDLANELQAKGRPERLKRPADYEDKQKRSKLARHYLSQETLRDRYEMRMDNDLGEERLFLKENTLAKRISEIMSGAELTNEEISLLETLE